MNTQKINALLLHPSDNVATVTASATRGSNITYELCGKLYDVVSADDIPVFHKIAIRDVPIGSPVVKYGETIGKATMDIRKGAHVHVHNVKYHT